MARDTLHWDRPFRTVRSGGFQTGASGLLLQVFGGAVLAEDEPTDRQSVLEGLYLRASQNTGNGFEIQGLCPCR